MTLYDGIDYRYTSEDPEREKGIAIISNILGFRPDADGLHYSLNFYSGGTGVDNRLAIRCRLEASVWPDVIAKLALKPVSAALSDPNWSESLLWLVCGDKPEQDVNDACRDFIDSNRRNFQDAAGIDSDVLFTDESDVNTWCVVWISNGYFNYVSFEQG